MTDVMTETRPKVQTIAELLYDLVEINTRFDELVREGHENTPELNENHRQFEDWCDRLEAVYRHKHRNGR